MASNYSMVSEKLVRSPTRSDFARMFEFIFLQLDPQYTFQGKIEEEVCLFLQLQLILATKEVLSALPSFACCPHSPKKSFECPEVRGLKLHWLRFQSAGNVVMNFFIYTYCFVKNGRNPLIICGYAKAT